MSFHRKQYPNSAIHPCISLQNTKFFGIAVLAPTVFIAMSQISQAALQSLDDNSRKEILEFIEAENSKSKVQMSIHNFTDMCFKKCNENRPITSNALDKTEEQCLSNCLNRFLDTNIKVVQALQGQK